MFNSDFISESEQKRLIEWANGCKSLLTPNGHGRFYNQLKYLPSNDLVYIIKQRIIDSLLKDQDYVLDPHFTDFLSFNLEGGEIHSHTDPNIPDRIHTRYNLIISKPFSGGNPIYNGKTLHFEERMLWRCEAGIIEHASLPVIGDKPRINLSFGFQLKT